MTGYLVHRCAAILVTQSHVGTQATEVLDDVPVASCSSQMEGSPVRKQTREGSSQKEEERERRTGI